MFAKKAEAQPAPDYSLAVQKLLLSYMISDPTAFTTSQNIINPDHFDDALKNAVRFVLTYANDFKAVPLPEQIAAASGVRVERFPETSPQHFSWYTKTIEGFARFKALEHAIIEGVDLLEQGRGGELEALVKAAMTISLMHDMGTDYFADPAGRLERMKDRSQFISTGWKTLDAKLGGGFTRGGLNIWAGGSGSGKSLWLQNIALNWANMGMHVVYISLELAEDLVSLRLDAMVSGFGTKQVFPNMEEVAMRVRMRGMKSGGTLTVKKMNEGGTTANDLRAFMKEYEIQTGRRPQALVVDYLDLMHPNNRAINPSDLFVKDKYVSEEMRGLAFEYDLVLATASQLNRSSVEAAEFDHSHIAGGISKINTADNVFAIFAQPHKREQGIYDLQFLKTRSSSAVGQKITMRYDPISMLISDADEAFAEATRTMSAEELQAELKLKTAAPKATDASPAPAAPPPPAPTSAATDRVRELMNRNKKRNEN